MKNIKIFIITIIALLFTTATANALNVTTLNNSPTPRSTTHIHYTPGASIYPKKTVYVAPLRQPYSRPAEKVTPCANNNPPADGGIRPVYPRFRVPVIHSVGAVHLSDLNSNGYYNDYNGRYYNGRGNNVYINNNGKVYINQ